MLFKKKEEQKTIFDLKQYLKPIAKKIRENKNRRKLDKRGDTPLWEIESIIFDLRLNYRHHHIAYCELRGRIREQIEKPGEYNLPSESIIKKVKEKYGKALRHSPQRSE
jgi:hypothetical protein